MRRHAFVLALAFVSLISVSYADEQIPLELLTKIKANTAFIRVKTPAGEGSGSGFVIATGRDRKFVVTNDHVVSLKGAASKRKQGSKPEITVIFGTGTGHEFEKTAEVIVTDPVKDLAVLKLSDQAYLGDGLDYQANVKISETLPVCMIGFPFGKMLAARNENPVATVGRGHISSIREDGKRGKIIQIDGDLNPGNSGGPVVDTKGRLVGVAVAKIDRTNIGFVIPASEIPKMLETRVPQLTVTADKPLNKLAWVRCEVEAFDPAERIELLRLRYRPSINGQPLTKAEKDLTWPEMENAEVAEFKFAKGKGSTSFQIAMNDATPLKYDLQLILRNNDNLTSRSEIITVTIDPARTATIAAKDRIPANSPRTITLVENLMKRPVAVGNLKVHSVLVEGVNAQRDMCWSQDEKSLCFVGADGVVRRFSCPNLQPESTFPSEMASGARLTSSAAGLVVSGGGDVNKKIYQKGEVWRANRVVVLDESLKPLRTIEEDSIYRVVSTPSSNFGYGRAGNKRGEELLSVIDLSKGEIVKRYLQSELGNPKPSLDRMVISADGNWLFTRDEQRLYRFRIQGADVKLDETSPPILRKDLYRQIALSYDGKWLESPFVHDDETMKRSHISGGTANKPFDLFSSSSLTKPALTWFTMNPPSLTGFDRANGFIFANSGNSLELEVFDIHGNMVNQYDTRDILKGHNVQQMLVHPDGRYVAYLLYKSPIPSTRIVLLELLAPTPES